MRNGRCWEWIIVTGDGVAVAANTGLRAALAAVGINADSDDVTGDHPYFLEFRWSARPRGLAP